MRKDEDLVQRVTQYSAVLLGFTMTAVSFLYSVLVQLVRINAQNVSEWDALIHLMVIAAIIFLLALMSGITSYWNHRFRPVTLVLFSIGILFVMSVLASLYQATRF